MPALVEPTGPQAIADIAEPIVDLAKRGLILQAESAIAFAALWFLRRVEAGHMTAEEADQAIAMIDVGLTDAGFDDQLSEKTRELLLEGHHFHHFGDSMGPDPDHLRSLAYSIIERMPRR